MSVSRMFPIMYTSDRYDDRGTVVKLRAKGVMFQVVGIPWDLIARCEAQALKNHSQTLERLAQRGGLSAGEAVAVLTGKGWHEIPNDEAAAHQTLAHLMLGASE